MVEVTLLALILAGCTVTTNHVRDAVIILADGSQSMAEAGDWVQEKTGEIWESLPGSTSVGVVSFAGDTVIVKEVGAKRREPKLKSPEYVLATDIDSALTRAEALFPPNCHQRMILLTDGLQTGGNWRIARELANRNIRLDAVLYEGETTEEEVEVCALEMPKEVLLGETYRVVVRVASRAEGSARLTLLDGEECVKEQNVQLKSGMNEYAYRITSTQPGMRIYTARIEPQEDTIPQNNSFSACVNVVSSSKILVIDGTGEESGALMELLEHNGYEAECIVPKDIPRTVAAMCQYGVIILMNVDERDLPDAAADQLREYVEVYGRSVLTTGGENTYAYGHMVNTAFDDFLPVGIEVKEEQSAQSVALMLVIDNSASMGEVQTAMAEDTINPLEMAKRGAIKCISALHDNDYVGVISFSDSYYVLAELASARERDYAISRVSRMNTVGGTMYCQALEEAYRQLEALEATGKKHVIFISDGNPGDEGYRETIQSMHASEITVSTIAVGMEINKELMEELAQIGGGEFTQVLDINELPTIMLSDTVLQQVEYRIDEPVAARIRQPLEGVDEGQVLELGGYIRAQLRPEANLILESPEERPIYAQWRYGEGQAGAFMSDLGSRWGGAFMASDEGRNFVLRMIESLIPMASENLPVTVSITQGGRMGTLLAECTEDQAQRMEASVRAPSGEEQTVQMVRTNTGVYEGNMPVDEYGRYDLTLRHYSLDGELLRTTETAAAASWSREYEAFWSQEERDALEQACAVTGGAVYRDVKEAAQARMDEVYVEYSPRLLLSVLLMASVLLDLFGRQIGAKYLAPARKKVN